MTAEVPTTPRELAIQTVKEIFERRPERVAQRTERSETAEEDRRLGAELADKIFGKASESSTN